MKKVLKPQDQEIRVLSKTTTDLVLHAPHTNTVKDIVKQTCYTPTNKKIFNVQLSMKGHTLA